jgi:hypothetical protein
MHGPPVGGDPIRTNARDERSTAVCGRLAHTMVATFSTQNSEILVFLVTTQPFRVTAF